MGIDAHLCLKEQLLHFKRILNYSLVDLDGHDDSLHNCKNQTLEQDIANFRLAKSMEIDSMWKNIVEILNTITKNNTAKIKHFKSPPQCIELVAEAVCLLFDKPTSWIEFLKLVNHPNFIASLISFNAKSVSEATAKKLKKFIENPAFNAEDIDRYYSITMGKVCSWVNTVYQVSLVQVLIAVTLILKFKLIISSYY